jgi:hypothetical protein
MVLVVALAWHPAQAVVMAKWAVLDFVAGVAAT